MNFNLCIADWLSYLSETEPEPRVSAPLRFSGCDWRLWAQVYAVDDQPNLVSLRCRIGFTRGGDRLVAFVCGGHVSLVSRRVGVASRSSSVDCLVSAPQEGKTESQFVLERNDIDFVYEDTVILQAHIEAEQMYSLGVDYFTLSTQIPSDVRTHRMARMLPSRPALVQGSYRNHKARVSYMHPLMSASFRFSADVDVQLASLLPPTSPGGIFDFLMGLNGQLAIVGYPFEGPTVCLQKLGLGLEWQCQRYDLPRIAGFTYTVEHTMAGWTAYVQEQVGFMEQRLRVWKLDEEAQLIHTQMITSGDDPLVCVSERSVFVFWHGEQNQQMLSRFCLTNPGELQELEVRPPLDVANGDPHLFEKEEGDLWMELNVWAGGDTQNKLMLRLDANGNHWRAVPCMGWEKGYVLSVDRKMMFLLDEQTDTLKTVFIEAPTLLVLAFCALDDQYAKTHDRKRLCPLILNELLGMKNFTFLL